MIRKYKCQQCGKDFESSDRNRKYCSTSCAGKVNGKKSHGDGLTWSDIAHIKSTRNRKLNAITLRRWACDRGYTKEQILDMELPPPGRRPVKKVTPVVESFETKWARTAIR